MSSWRKSCFGFRVASAILAAVSAGVSCLTLLDVSPAVAADVVRQSPARASSGNATTEAPAQATEGDDVVTCFAGCVGRRGEVLVRTKLPPLSPEAANRSSWRLVAHNLWCHDEFGCRSYNVVPYRRWCHRTYRTIAVYHHYWRF